MNEEEIDLKELLILFWKKKTFIIGIVIISIIIGFAFTFLIRTQSYTAHAKIMFGRVENYEPQEGESQLLSEIQFNTSIISNYKNFMTSDDVLKTVINNLQLDITLGDFKKNIEIETSNGTIELNVSYENPEMAEKLANEILQVFVEKARDFYQINHTYSISEADESTTKTDVSHITDLLCFTIAGFIISCGIILVKYLFDPFIISESDIEDKLNLSFISSIIIKKDKKGNVIENVELSEQFDVLRANIEFSLKDYNNQKTFFITSSNKGDGKTFVSMNLALAFSKISKKVLIIDTDKKSGALDEIFEVDNKYGLSNYLVDSNKISESENKSENNLIQKTKYDNLDVITIGTVKGNKFKIIQNQKFIKFLDEMKEKYDIVILDGSEMVAYADSRFLSNLCDQTLLIANKNKTKEKDLLQAVKEIEKIKGNLLGIVLNKVENRNIKMKEKKV